jgi:DNA-binding NarL/FixJ family response regulator
VSTVTFGPKFSRNRRGTEPYLGTGLARAGGGTPIAEVADRSAAVDRTAIPKRMTTLHARPDPDDEARRSPVRLQAVVAPTDIGRGGPRIVSETATISVAIVDDHPIVLRGLESIIAAEPDMVVVATASDGEEAVRRVLATRPDVVLMDVRMPGTDGVEAAKRILEARPDIRIVLLSGERDASVIAALKAGAYGFLSKAAITEGLVNGVRDAASGRPVLPATLVQDVLDALRAPRSPNPLTPRQRQIMEAVASGQTNEQIAHGLGLSVSTVKAELAAINERIGASDRASALAISFREGWIE